MYVAGANVLLILLTACGGNVKPHQPPPEAPVAEQPAGSPAAEPAAPATDQIETDEAPPAGEQSARPQATIEPPVPVQPESAQVPVPGTPAPAPQTRTDAASVMIIEDNADSRRMLEAMLKLDGYAVHSAGSGGEGLAAILELRPQVAIIDIGLPEMDGYQVAKQVREVIPKEDLFLIALTGYGRPEDRRAVQEAGFDEHLIKPLKPHELARVLGTAVNNRNA